LTLPCSFEILSLHTVTTEQKTGKNMRTKTLLIAAAALAAGILTSSAQTYSQNIVGYVNLVFPPGQYSMVVAPLQTANNVNNAEQLFSGLTAGDSILLWNGGGFDYYAFAVPGLWIGPSGPGLAPTVNAGTPVFFFNSSGGFETNTVVGTVVLSNSVPLFAGYSMAGSTAPVAGALDNSTNFSLPYQAGDNVLIFNGSGYDYYANAAPGLWIGPGGPGPAPSVNVGQAFFYYNNSGGTENWIQNVVVP
jgi:hypothetical protein